MVKKRQLAARKGQERGSIFTKQKTIRSNLRRHSKKWARRHEKGEPRKRYVSIWLENRSQTQGEALLESFKAQGPVANRQYKFTCSEDSTPAAAITATFRSDDDPYASFLVGKKRRVERIERENAAGQKATESQPLIIKSESEGGLAEDEDDLSHSDISED
ncbi:hypothetical protein BCR34DRAFT_245178 [Clohesyomyces aquaticus]|uniref:Uncharacterized protein n=1 Tax=Clohesyomyces aquaticus TaxID=1231657 RepID=A0A1Y1ZUW3_9PLEO|nr:hypothetical protein BCR34DRAFT_245178 [Clohesyomyces aquaticus]